MSCDLKDFFHVAPMVRQKYFNTPPPQDIINQCNLHTKTEKNSYLYKKTKKGIYGLKQAAILAHDGLVKNLSPFGYKPIPHTLVPRKHEQKPIIFYLFVDDFGIKYKRKEDS